MNPDFVGLVAHAHALERVRPEAGDPGGQEPPGALAQALAALPEEDREIFYRFYDLSQTTAQIADEVHMNASTVRSRLLRGREALRKTLTKGGLFCEDDVG